VQTDSLEARLLGDFQIRVGERVIPAAAWKQRKAAAIVKLLALEPSHRLHREQILDALWPELDPDAAANNLRVALHAVRRILDAGGIPIREGQHLVLGTSDTIWVDVLAFEAALDRAWRDSDLNAFQTAIDLYAGDLLPADPYEEWIETRRASLRTSYLAALARIARLQEERDNTNGAIATWQRVLKSEPATEEAHVQLMLLLARAGRKQDALAQYDMLVSTLNEELGVEPDPIVRELADAIRNDQVAKAGDRQTDRLTSPVTGLPVPPETLIGRERELAEVRQALTASRLVTITGPGGAGKTRLTIELAGSMADTFPGGVYYVPLAPLRDSNMLDSFILQALGIANPLAKTPVEALVEYLRERSVLLVLDNFEHLVDAAPIVSMLLEGCSTLKVLTTSRIPLRIRGEREYPLRSLSEAASAELFIERSTAVRPDFVAGNDQLPSIVQICRRLDGLPLAIELAAARSRVLAPETLLQRLERPLDVLTSGSRDLPDRQQTLRATIAWSYDLLEPDIQKLFRALAVFAPGWTLEATGAVCPDGVDVLDGLTVLVESNLLEQYETDGKSRFRMLETIREYGLEQLEAAGETEEISRRHADYYLTFAEEVTPDLRGARSAVRHVELSSHHDNLRAALAWALEHNPDRGLRVAANLEKYWLTRGVFTEWEYWLSELVERSSDEALIYRARALHQIAYVASQKGDLERAWTLAEETLKLAQEFGLDESMGRVKTIMGFIVERAGNTTRAIELAEEALAHYRNSGFELPIATQLQVIASLVISAGEYERGLKLHEEAQQLQRRIGDTFFIAMGLVDIGVVLRHLGRIPEAVQHIDEALELARAIGASYILAYALVARGQVAIDEENYDLARELLVESAHHASLTSISYVEPAMLEGLAAVLTANGNPYSAVQVFAASETARKTLNLPMTETSRLMCEHHLSMCRSMMDAEFWERARESGARLSIDEATKLALDALKPSESDAQ
jgi:predicted ATPase/DNA-binding SARP family transcriptional activator